MATLAHRLGLYAVCAAPLVLGACDRADDTHLSFFYQETDRERSILGAVRSGPERVASALVYVAPGTTLGEAGGIAPLEVDRTQTTDVSGRYSFRVAPLRYDLTVRAPAEVLVYRDVGGRVLEPTLAWQAPPRVFTCRLQAAFTRELGAETAVSYFVSGEAAVDVQGGGPTGAGPLTASFRAYSSMLTLHAVAHPVGGSLAEATAYGRVEVRVRDGASFAFPLELLPITGESLTTTFAVQAPATFSAPALDVQVDLGLRTSTHPVTTLSDGGSLTIRPIPGARWTVRGHAEAEGAMSDSGVRFFDPAAPKTTIPLPDVPTVEPPAEGAVLEADAALVALGPNPAFPGIPAEDRTLLRGPTVVEHVLEPLNGGRQPVRVVTVARATSLPDLAPVGLTLHGDYRWSVQSWPDLARPEGLSGPEARIVLTTSRTAPRRITIR